jgi:hypothetical protein
VLLERSDEDGKDKIEEALAPPNRVDPITQLPYGWKEDEELDGFDQLMGG